MPDSGRPDAWCLFAGRVSSDAKKQARTVILACLICARERVMGIEPTLSAWKAEVLPLNYTRGA